MITTEIQLPKKGISERIMDWIIWGPKKAKDVISQDEYYRDLEATQNYYYDNQ